MLHIFSRNNNEKPGSKLKGIVSVRESCCMHRHSPRQGLRRVGDRSTAMERAPPPKARCHLAWNAL